MPDNYRSKDLRKGRYSECNRIYHITASTHNRHPWFNNLICGRIIVKTLQKAQIDTKTLAYVIMPDHMHWLMQLKKDTGISKVVKNIKGKSAIEINQHLGRKGSIWQNGFYDHAIRKDEQIINIARYIIANPVRAGLVSSVREYPLWDAMWLQE